MHFPALLILLVLADLLTSPRALASPRYNDPAASQPRPSLAARIEALACEIADQLATEKHQPKGLLRVDARLEAAGDLLVTRLPPNGPPAEAVTDAALWASGIVEPSPALLTLTVPDGADADALVQLSRLLPPILARGRFSRVAASLVELHPGVSRLLLTLQESFIDLVPVPRSLPDGGAADLAGHLLPPYKNPGLLVTAPDGSVEHPALRQGAGQFFATFRCGRAPGDYQVELVGEDAQGEAILANFPVRCGAPPTVANDPLSAAEADDPPVTGVADAEARALELLQADRRRAGLPSLAIDPQLVAVARAHSADMRDHNFFGHISPTTGSASDRLSRAAVPALRVRENVARGYSPRELERGLMGSPAHRVNLLAGDVERVGVGVTLGTTTGSDGPREIYLTQLFTHQAAAPDPAHAAAEVLARVNGLRKTARRPSLAPDPALEQLAASLAEEIAAGRVAPNATGSSSPVTRAWPALKDRYRTLLTVVVSAAELSQLEGNQLLEPAATHAGAAARPSHTASEPAIRAGTPTIFVVLLATKR